MKNKTNRKITALTLALAMTFNGSGLGRTFKLVDKKNQLVTKSSAVTKVDNRMELPLGKYDVAKKAYNSEELVETDEKLRDKHVYKRKLGGKKRMSRKSVM